MMRSTEWTVSMPRESNESNESVASEKMGLRVFETLPKMTFGRDVTIDFSKSCVVIYFMCELCDSPSSPSQS